MLLFAPLKFSNVPILQTPPISDPKARRPSFKIISKPRTPTALKAFLYVATLVPVSIFSKFHAPTPTHAPATHHKRTHL
ncbi:MAG TPA: hypothetical protein VGB73_17905 [Pyrinomonadaceae bacterium]